MKLYYKRSQFTELQDGLCHRVGDQLVDSSEEIQITSTGGQMTNCAYSAFFNSQLNQQGAVSVVLPEGGTISTKIIGISYWDSASGQTILLSELGDSTGQLLPSKTDVIYPNIFPNDFACDCKYTLTKAGLSQDLILRQQPPDPGSVGMTNGSQTVWLQILTEIFDPPAVGISPSWDGGIENDYLSFGQMAMPQGYAFIIGDEAERVPVFKQLKVLDGRTVLIEQVPLQVIAAQLQTLPPPPAPAGGSQNPPPSGIRHKLSPKLRLPPPQLAKRSSGGLKLAAKTARPEGLVLDYLLVTTTGSKTLACDTTYYVSGSVTIGTLTVEGGTVVKIITNSATAGITVSTNLIWNTASYRPAVFTSSFDNSTGDKITGSTGNPATNFAGNIALNLSALSSPNISNVRFSYLSNALSGSAITVSDAQFVQCYSVFAGTATNTFWLRNVLGYKLGSLQSGSGSSALTVSAENITLHFCTNFLNFVAGSSVSLTNCLFVCATNFLAGNTTNVVSSAILNDDTGVFQTVGAGSAYLADGSVYRASGTTNNLNPALILDLQLKTTCPPLVFAAGTYSTNLALFPRAARNTNSSPDIGYSYDPLDYVFSAAVITNCTLSLSNGVAVGTYGSLGLQLAQGGAIISQGLPNRVNRIVRFNTAQEQATTNWADNVVFAIRYVLNGSFNTNAASQFNFTDWSVLASDAYQYYEEDEPSVSVPVVMTFQNNYFHGGLYFTRETQNATNCLFERVNQDVGGGPSATNLALFINCEFYNGTLSGRNTGIGTSHVITGCTNCFFDHTSIANGSGDYNGFITGANQLAVNGTHKPLLSSITYKASYLGPYYQATNSGLANLGSTTADQLGLYHYTTTTNQTIQGTNVVDLGLHYVATDTNGVPLSYSGDGLGDYLKDSNGDGVYNSTVDLGNWLTNSTAGDGISDYLKYIEGRNLKVANSNVDTNWIVNLKVYTPLK